MNAHTTKTFKSGNSVAVRLPKGLGIGEGVEVELRREGAEVVIRRKPKMTTCEMLEALSKLPRPTYVQEREPIEFPERPGL
jgi:antitoxin VapB